MGELPADGETRDSQDRPGVNPAGAGRKNECLSREVCRSAEVVSATTAAMRKDGAAEVSRGHSIHLRPRRRRTSPLRPLGERGEGPNSKTQGTAEETVFAMEQKTQQLAFNYVEEGEAHPGRGEGSQAKTALQGTGALAPGLMEAVVEPDNMRLALKRVQSNKGSAGVDGMSVRELAIYLKEHWPRIRRYDKSRNATGE